MRWHEEQYVRVYTRDSTNWLLLSWQTRAVFLFILRKLDRTGRLQVDPELRGLAKALDVPHDVVVDALRELRATKPQPTIALEDPGDGTLMLSVPNFVEAQTARRADSGAERQRAHRERQRSGKAQMTLPLAGEPPTSEPPRSAPAPAIEEGGERPRNGVTSRVTEPVTAVTGVTPLLCSAVQCSTDPDQGGVGGASAPPADAPPPSGRFADDDPDDEEVWDDPRNHFPPPRDRVANAPQAVGPPKPSPTRLPLDWKPAEADLELLRRELSVDPTPAVGKFRDFWHAAHGRRAERHDWNATFRDFIRKERGLPPWPPPRPRLVRAPPPEEHGEHPTAGLAPGDRQEKARSMMAEIDRALEARGPPTPR